MSDGVKEAARCDGIAIGAREAAKMRGRWCPRSATLVWCVARGASGAASGWWVVKVWSQWALFGVGLW